MSYTTHNTSTSTSTSNFLLLIAPVRYPVMCTLGFIVINLVLVTVTIAICVFGPPVLSCYMYTCTIITLRYLFDQNFINLISIICSIFMHYACYMECLPFVCGVVGAFGGGLQFTFTSVIFNQVLD